MLTLHLDIYICNKNQLDALFILSLFCQSTSTYFGGICSPSLGGLLFVFLALQPIVVVFSQPGSGL